ncbi:MAG: hypothetical protein V3U54_07770 [Thermodesulfobacteriota bacterium]
MIKTITKYVDPISGQEFKTKEHAKASEKRSRDIMTTFAFYKEPKDPGCQFSNGEFCIQRDKEFYNCLVDGLIKMVKKYEKWVYSEYKKKLGVMKREHIQGYSLLGRYLDDGDSDLYKWWGIQANVCPKCFREYGQLYYANNCKHNNSIVTRTMRN